MRPPAQTDVTVAVVRDAPVLPVLDRASVRRIALERHPSLTGARAAIAEAEAAVTEVRLYPNPELSVEGEEMPRDFSTGPGLVIWGINQTIITGGKRRWRIRAATSGVSRAALAYEQAALEAVRDATRAYYDLLGATRRIDVARRLAALAEDFATRVQVRVEGGVARPIEADRAVVLAAQARSDVRRAVADEAIARQALASALAVPVSGITTPAGPLEHRGQLPPRDTLDARARAHSPLLKIPLVEEEAAKSELALGRALRVPDVTAGLSVQHQSQPDASHDLRGFAITVPLPVINHGQAARARARALIAGAVSRQRLAELSLANRLTAAHQTAVRAHDQIETYLHDVLPAARRAVDVSLEGYTAGEFSYLEVLDAQRSLASTNQTYFDLLVEYQRARAELEEIVAGEVPELPEHEDRHEEP